MNPIHDNHLYQFPSGSVQNIPNYLRALNDPHTPITPDSLSSFLAVQKQADHLGKLIGNICMVGCAVKFLDFKFTNSCASSLTKPDMVWYVEFRFLVWYANGGTGNNVEWATSGREETLHFPVNLIFMEDKALICYLLDHLGGKDGAVAHADYKRNCHRRAMEEIENYQA